MKRLVVFIQVSGNIDIHNIYTVYAIKSINLLKCMNAQGVEDI